MVGVLGLTFPIILIILKEFLFNATELVVPP
jgi:hypothetical protein